MAAPESKVEIHRFTEEESANYIIDIGDTKTVKEIIDIVHGYLPTDHATLSIKNKNVNDGNGHYDDKKHVLRSNIDLWHECATKIKIGLFYVINLLAMSNADSQFDALVDARAYIEKLLDVKIFMSKMGDIDYCYEKWYCNAYSCSSVTRFVYMYFKKITPVDILSYMILAEHYKTAPGPALAIPDVDKRRITNKLMYIFNENYITSNKINIDTNKLIDNYANIINIHDGHGRNAIDQWFMNTFNFDTYDVNYSVASTNYMSNNMLPLIDYFSGTDIGKLIDYSDSFELLRESSYYILSNTLEYKTNEYFSSLHRASYLTGASLSIDNIAHNNNGVVDGTLFDNLFGADTCFTKLIDGKITPKVDAVIYIFSAMLFYERYDGVYIKIYDTMSRYIDERDGEKIKKMYGEHNAKSIEMFREILEDLRDIYKIIKFKLYNRSVIFAKYDKYNKMVRKWTGQHNGHDESVNYYDGQKQMPSSSITIMGNKIMESLVPAVDTGFENTRLKEMITSGTVNINSIDEFKTEQPYIKYKTDVLKYFIWSILVKKVCSQNGLRINKTETETQATIIANDKIIDKNHVCRRISPDDDHNYIYSHVECVSGPFKLMCSKYVILQKIDGKIEGSRIAADGKKSVLSIAINENYVITSLTKDGVEVHNAPPAGVGGVITKLQNIGVVFQTSAAQPDVYTINECHKYKKYLAKKHEIFTGSIFTIEHTRAMNRFDLKFGNDAYAIQDDGGHKWYSFWVTGLNNAFVATIATDAAYPYLLEYYIILIEFGHEEPGVDNKIAFDSDFKYYHMIKINRKNMINLQFDSPRALSYFYYCCYNAGKNNCVALLSNRYDNLDDYYRNLPKASHVSSYTGLNDVDSFSPDNITLLSNIVGVISTTGDTNIGTRTDALGPNYLKSIIPDIRQFVDAYEECRYNGPNPRPDCPLMIKTLLAEIEIERGNVNVLSIATSSDIAKFIHDHADKYYKIIKNYLTIEFLKELNAAMASSAVCTELKKIYDNINPEVLRTKKNVVVCLFEILFGAYIRKDQLKLYGDIVDEIDDHIKYKDKSRLADRVPYKIHHMLMGKGKSAVIVPLILFHYVISDKLDYVILLMPKHLIKQSLDDISSNFSVILNGRSIKHITVKRNDSSVFESHTETKGNITLIDDTNLKMALLNNATDPGLNNLANRIKNQALIITDEFDSIYDPTRSTLKFPSTDITVETSKLLGDTYLLTSLIDTIFEFVFEGNKPDIDIEYKDTPELLQKKLLLLCRTLDALKDQVYKQQYGFPTEKNDDLEIEESHSTQFIGVPYSAVNVPIPGSQYSKLEINIVVTILTYANYTRDTNFMRYVDFKKIFEEYRLTFIGKDPVAEKKIYFNTPLKKLVKYDSMRDPKYVDTDGKLVDSELKSLYDTLQHNLVGKHKNNLNGEKERLARAKIDEKKKVANIRKKIKRLKQQIEDGMNNIIVPIIKEHLEDYCIPNLRFAREFLSCSAIDIISGHFSKFKTGFSGTLYLQLPYKINDVKYAKECLPYDYDTRLNKDAIANGSIYASMLGLYNATQTTTVKVVETKPSTILQQIADIVRDNRYDAFIDNGAFFIKETTEDVVQKFASVLVGKKKFIYLDKNSKKKIYDRDVMGASFDNKVSDFDNKVYARDDVFIYYDNKHIVGIDIKQAYNLRGLVSVGKFSDMSGTAQACYRFRNLNYGQEIEFVVSETVINENTEFFKDMNNVTKVELVDYLYSTEDLNVKTTKEILKIKQQIAFIRSYGESDYGNIELGKLDAVHYLDNYEGKVDEEIERGDDILVKIREEEKVLFADGSLAGDLYQGVRFDFDAPREFAVGDLTKDRYYKKYMKYKLKYLEKKNMLTNYIN